MPNKHAAIKDLRKNARRAARNARLKAHMKHALRSAQDFLKAGKLKEAKTAASVFQQIVDKAAKNQVVSFNAARRKKSVLMRNIAKVK